MVGCLDRAIDYIRLRGAVIVPQYVIAILPQSLGAYLAIDAVVSQDRSMLPIVSLLLVAGTLVRWVGTSAMQYRIQGDILGKSPRVFARRLPTILAIRMLAAVGILWCALLLGKSTESMIAGLFLAPIHSVTSLFGIFVAVLVAPLAFESSSGPSALLDTLVRWILKASWRLGGLVFYLSVMVLWGVIAILVVDHMMTNVVVANFLGLDSSDLALTLESVAWTLSELYLLWLIIDFMWSVVGVFLLYDIQSRRMGSDLRLRLRSLQSGVRP